MRTPSLPLRIIVVMAVALLVSGTRASAATTREQQPRSSSPTCDPAAASTCALRQLATPAGMRIGATAEPDQTAPGPYADTLAREFNAVTPENALKWYTVQPAPGDWRFGPADTVVDFAEANDLEVRGHTLVWAQDRFTPDWVRAITDTAEMQMLVDEQITTVMNRYAGRIHRWDVVNEPFESLGAERSDSVFWDVLGPDWVADAFRTAHAADPDAELWLNEYGTDYVPGKHDALVDLVAGLLDDGVPVHGVGLQVHRPTVDGPDVASFTGQLREFAELGVDVAITELDIPIHPDDPDGFEKQAAAYERVVGSCLAVDRCREVTTWGVSDGSTWLDGLGVFPTPTRPLLFDDDFRPKPAHGAVRDLLARELNPDTTSTTTAPPAVVTPPPPAVPVPAEARFTG